MSSNLLKHHFTYVKDDDKRVIDTNDLLAKRIEELRKQEMVAAAKEQETSEDGFTSGLSAEHLGVLLADEEDLQNLQEEAAEPAVPLPTSEELMQNALAEIEQMKQEAAAQLEAERRKVLEEAKNAGFAEGVENAQRQYREKEAALEKRAAQLEQDYQKLVAELEPEFIDTLTGIYEHIFRVDLGKYREVLIHLISSAIRKAEGCKEFVVRVSGEDYPYVSMQKKQLQSAVNLPGSVVEVVEDLNLGRNECMIETGTGIFDCSLGTELEELSGKLKLLSYERPE